MNYTVLDNICARTEHVLNKTGWIPFVSWVSGGIRLVAGKIMVIAGLVMASFYFFKGIFVNDPSLGEHARHYAGYAIHGMGNMCRGLVEMIPFVNLVCLVYDAFVGRFSYSQEIMERGVKPLNPYHYQFEVVNF